MLKKIYPIDQLEKYLLIDVVSLLYLITWLVLDSSIRPLEKILFIIIYVLAYYVGLWNRDQRLLAASCIGWMLLAIFAVKTGTWLLLYGFVFAHLLGRANRRLLIGVGMFGIVSMFVLYGRMHEGSWTAVFNSFYLPVMIAQMVTPVIVSMRLNAHLLKEKLDVANQQLERYIQEEERNRIARDLHDTLGQTLTMIKLKSELALRYIERNPGKAKDEVEDILNSSRYALKQVGELVTDMKYVSLEDEIGQSKAILQKAGVRIDIAVEQTGSLLSPSAETMLALAMREAVTNIIKHSGASQCVIKQYVQQDEYVVQVRDNGNGNLKAATGNGLQSMNERLAMLQGEMILTSNPNKGTTVTFKVPLKHNRRVTLT